MNKYDKGTTQDLNKTKTQKNKEKRKQNNTVTQGYTRSHNIKQYTKTINTQLHKLQYMYIKSKLDVIDI